jgi:hypothetical protein
MAPSTASHHTNQSSPPSETHPPKRSLRNRNSNAANSSQTDIVVGDIEKEVGEIDVDNGVRSDARGGKFPLFFFVPSTLNGKIKLPLPG